MRHWSSLIVFGIVAVAGSVLALSGCGEEPVAGLPDLGTTAADGGSDPEDGAVGFAITTTDLPSGTIGAAYTTRLAASGGVEPFTFVLLAGEALPSGLSLESDGTIAGTPSVAGSATFAVEAFDSAPAPARDTATLTLAINPESGTTLVITTSFLAEGTVGEPYNNRLEASGGTAPLTFSVASGALPGGLSLAPDGALSGAPLSAGSASFLVQVTDQSVPNQIATRRFTMAIKPANGAPLVIETTALADGTVADVYADALVASGGTPPYFWSLAAGTNLPSGLILNADGTITGSPALAGQTTFTVQVIDSASPSQLASAEFTISIAPENAGTPLEIITASLPDATLAQTYTATLAATGGNSPYTFSLAAGVLPPGMSLLPAGQMGGAPLQAGTFAFTVQCNDVSVPPQVATRSLSITVLGGPGDPLAIITAGLPNGVAGTAYSAQLAATGGLTPYQWALDPASSLPSGLALDALGNITGTPDTAGRFAFNVFVVDASMPQQTASAALTITVASAPGNTLQITTNILPDATAGVAYSQQLAASGGTTPYTWTLVQGSLPLGVDLNPSGLISGTATITGTYGFTVEVSDASMPQETAQATFTLNVNPPANQGLIITTAGLPRAIVGASYGAQLQAAGGTSPYVWALTGGALPPGLTLTSTGAIWGVATVAGSYRFTVEVTDGSATPLIATRQLSLVAFASPSTGIAILNQNLHSGVVDRTYNAQIAVAGGTRPYTHTISAGALPDGLSLGATDGRITGTATVAGIFNFTVTVSDSSTPQLSSSRNYTVTIRSGARRLRITSRNLAMPNAGVPYQTTLAAANGTPPYVWSISMGSLPMGLTLTSTGSISGTAAAPGSSMFTVLVTDNGNPPQTATRDFTLNVRP